MHFSLMPPTGRDRPWRLISPVMAMSDLTRRPVRRETRATVMVVPALGPSLGVAAAGKCTWRSMFLKTCLIIFCSEFFLLFSSEICTVLNGFCKMPRLCEFDKIQLIDVFTDSRITSPSFPVSLSWPVPGNIVVSTKSALPPMEV